MNKTPTLVATRTALDKPTPEATSLPPVQTGESRPGAAGLSPKGS